jgi:GT2 family glycosyltransferase
MGNRIAVVILNFNGAEMLRAFLPSVVDYSPEAEVIVADNCSTDASAQVMREEFPTVRYIQLEKNYGFADGYNRALAQVEAEYFLLLNSDVEVTQGWLAPMLEYMDSHPDVAACQPKLLSYKNKKEFEYAGACGGFIDKYGYPYCRGRIFDTVEEDKGQ